MWAPWIPKPIILIVYSIFALYRDTENIHSSMMIWLIIFIISNYSLASSPPKVPGGVKRDIFSESRTLIHRAFSDQKYQNSFPKEWYLYFHSLCTICHKKLCIFLPKRKDDWYDMMGYNLGKYTGTILHKNLWRFRKTKVREKKLSSYQAFLGRRGRGVVKVTIIQTDFNCLVLREAFCVVKFLKSVAN